MATRYPRAAPSLDQIGESSVVDPRLAESALLREIDDRQQALITEWGGTPFTKTVDWSHTGTSSTTYYDVIRVPPGVEFVQVALVTSGYGTVTLTSTHDSTGTTLRTISEEGEIAEARDVWSTTEEDVDAAASAPPLRVAPGDSGYLWEWTDVEVEAVVTAASGLTCQVYAVAYIPLHRPRSDTGLTWAATHSIDFVGANSQYFDISGSEKHFNHADGFTVLCWFKADNANAAVWSFGDASADTSVFGTAVDGSGYLRYLGVATGSTYQDLQGSTTTGTGWRHAAWTITPSSDTSGDSVIYLDGSNEDQTDAQAGSTDITTALDLATLGVRRRSTFGTYFDGKILEWAVIPRVLTSAEVTEAYNSGTPVDVRTLSFGAYVADYFVGSACDTTASTVTAPNLGLAPTWSTASMSGSSVGTANKTTDVP